MVELNNPLKRAAALCQNEKQNRIATFPTPNPSESSDVGVQVNGDSCKSQKSPHIFFHSGLDLLAMLGKPMENLKFDGLKVIVIKFLVMYLMAIFVYLPPI